MCSVRFVFVVATCWFLQTTRGEDSCENLTIRGGRKVSIRDVPFVAAIFEDDSAVCVGTVVHESFILTAASCSSDDEPQQVLVGTARLNRGGQRYEVEKKICHSGFDTVTMENDICLLKLNSKIEFNRRVSQVELPPASLHVVDGALLNVTGWGSLNRAETKYPIHLYQTTVPKISNQCCSEEFDDITDSMICAGKKGYGACKGDGGAPLTFGNLLVGVFSAGEVDSCGTASGIYTKVSEYLNWIDEKISEYA